MNKFPHILRLLRPEQWIKNSFVFLPLFLNGDLADVPRLLMTTVAFFLFCLTSSAVYCINDAVDAPYDAVNPDKCRRPVASGALSRREAVGVACGLLVIVVCAAAFSGFPTLRSLLLPLGVYFVLNLAYSLGLKRVPVLDVVIISGCFLLRVWTGGIAAGIRLTIWTLVLVFLLTLMLAVGKRRHEAWLCENEGVVSRSNIRSYDVQILNWMLVVIGIAALVVYFIWTKSAYVRDRFSTDLVPFTTILVSIGILRYLWLLIRKDSGGNPTELLLQDNVIRLTVLIWIGSFAFFIYT
ncbi:MAG: UbiA family prenyltransferase [Muribaculaceae bacterium]|nr:UbiA family prenyltransferase [Muribaculaceae bacterium]